VVSAGAARHAGSASDPQSLLRTVRMGILLRSGAFASADPTPGEIAGRILEIAHHIPERFADQRSC